jgi:hypothetical protein
MISTFIAAMTQQLMLILAVKAVVDADIVDYAVQYNLRN